MASSVPSAPPPSPSETLRLTVRNLAGRTQRVLLAVDAVVDDLQLAVSRSPLCGVPPTPFQLAFAGTLLHGGARTLLEQGVVSGALVDVVRVTPPPGRVRLECIGYGCGPSIRGSCGTFVQAHAGGRAKN